MTVRWTRFLFLPILIAAATGCDNPDLLEVKGRLTHLGRPLPNILVTFLPADESRSSNGLTNEYGEFALKLSRADFGAKRGAHTVVLRPIGCRSGRRHKNVPKTSEDLRAIIVPYGNPQTSSLRLEVTHHGQFVEIDLE